MWLQKNARTSSSHICFWLNLSIKSRASIDIHRRYTMTLDFALSVCSEKYQSPQVRNVVVQPGRHNQSRSGLRQVCVSIYSIQVPIKGKSFLCWRVANDVVPVKRNLAHCGMQFSFWSCSTCGGAVEILHLLIACSCAQLVFIWSIFTLTSLQKLYSSKL